MKFQNGFRSQEGPASSTLGGRQGSICTHRRMPTYIFKNGDVDFLKNITQIKLGSNAALKLVQTTYLQQTEAPSAAWTSTGLWLESGRVCRVLGTPIGDAQAQDLGCIRLLTAVSLARAESFCL